MLDYFRLANPFFVDFFLKKITNNVLHRELKKNAPYPLPLLLNLTIAGYGLQVTEVCATYGTTDTQEILLQMREFFLPSDESFKEDPHPWERMECNFTIQNYFKFSKHNGHPTIKIAPPSHPVPPPALSQL